MEFPLKFSVIENCAFICMEKKRKAITVKIALVIKL